jgi:hypothetical protein
MAIAIKSIPTLKGEDAKRFNEKADRAYNKRATVDFSKQAKIARAILEKAKML